MSSSSHFLKSAIPAWPAPVPTEGGAGRRNLQSKIEWNLILFLLLLFVAIHGPVLSQPRSPAPEDSLLFREGEILFSRGEIEKALWRFKRLITEHPQSPL
ncbi:MAG: hypothetical protein Q8P64_02295, partial [Deltaproteobacteria bacterium]|nr:hypothetical protein [Deltaproteobacteria bacterium]